MSGSVWEWTWDWYDQFYYNLSPSVDPEGYASSCICCTSSVGVPDRMRWSAQMRILMASSFATP